MKPPVYLDYNATTPVDQRVLDRMLPFFTEHFGNPSSKGHPWGWAAEEAVGQVRETVAAALQTEPEEIIFTSGATEALNLAIKGVAEVYGHQGQHLVTVQTEHKAVLDTCRSLERKGFTITYLPVLPDGRIDPQTLEAALTQETILVAVMAANNETGVLQPLDELASLVRSRGILFLTDATQALGKIPVTTAGVDLLAGSAHKFYGPKGVGLLYVRRRNPRVRLAPLLDGGGQERGLRGGTLNVPGIVGLGAALELALAQQAEEILRLQTLRDHLETTLLAHLPSAFVNGGDVPRLPQTTNLTLPGLGAAQLLTGLRALGLSTGSACSSGTGKPSHVLKAMGLSDKDALSSLRFSLGRFTTRQDIDFAIEQTLAAAEQVRSSSLSIPS